MIKTHLLASVYHEGIQEYQETCRHYRNNRKEYC
mgnify:FL=1